MRVREKKRVPGRELTAWNAMWFVWPMHLEVVLHIALYFLCSQAFFFVIANLSEIRYCLISMSWVECVVCAQRAYKCYFGEWCGFFFALHLCCFCVGRFYFFFVGFNSRRFYRWFVRLRLFLCSNLLSTNSHNMTLVADADACSFSILFAVFATAPYCSVFFFFSFITTYSSFFSVNFLLFYSLLILFVILVAFAVYCNLFGHCLHKCVFDFFFSPLLFSFYLCALCRSVFFFGLLPFFFVERKTIV